MIWRSAPAFSTAMWPVDDAVARLKPHRLRPDRVAEARHARCSGVTDAVGKGRSSGHPGAKLGATAPYALAEYVVAETGKAQPRSLANAFLDPIRLDSRRSPSCSRSILCSKSATPWPLTLQRLTDMREMTARSVMYRPCTVGRGLRTCHASASGDRCGNATSSVIGHESIDLAPWRVMMSFGTVMVDRHGFIDRFPGTRCYVAL